MNIKEIEKLLETCTIAECAKKLNISYHNLYYFIKTNKIKYKNIKQIDRYSENYTRAKLASRKICIKEEHEIIKEYNDGLSITNIQNLHKNVNRITIYNILKRNDIKLRLRNGLDEISKTKLDRDTLEKLYITMELSCYRIRKMYPEKYSTHAMVIFDLKKLNIKSRNYRDAGLAIYKTDPEFKEKIIKRLAEIRKRDFKRNPSSLEMKFMTWAENNNILFEHQYRIVEPDGHCYDFLLCNTKTLVEIDGDYWHTTDDAKRRDKIFDKIAQKAGYNVIRIKGSEIKKYKDEIFNKKLGEIINGL